MTGFALSGCWYVGWFAVSSSGPFNGKTKLQTGVYKSSSKAGSRIETECDKGQVLEWGASVLLSETNVQH